MRVAFTVPGPVQAWQRAGVRVVGKFARHYTKDETRKYEALVKEHGRRAMVGKPIMDGPLRFSLRIRRTPLKGASKLLRAAMLDGEVRPATRPDCSNIAKGVEDALNEVVYVDDGQIVELVVIKVYAEEEGIDVVVEDWSKPA